MKRENLKVTGHNDMASSESIILKTNDIEPLEKNKDESSDSSEESESSSEESDCSSCPDWINDESLECVTVNVARTRSFPTATNLT